ILEIEMDEEGAIVESLEEYSKQTLNPFPKIFYTVPNFQNPTGITMSTKRREKLLEIAHEKQMLIVDDDPYGLLDFGGKRVPSFFEISPNDPYVVSTKSFSKLAAPGLRVGWAEASPEITQLLRNVKP